MTPTVRLGRVWGIPLAAHWSALVIPLLVADLLASSILPATVKGAGQRAYWVTGVVVAAVFLACLAAHEIAHALVARRLGLTVTGITLWMLGGMTMIEGDPKDPRSQLRIAIVGPATSLACGIVSGGVALGLSSTTLPKVAAAGAAWLAVTNVLLAVFNMLPGAPLDGGRVLRAIVWKRTGDPNRAQLVAGRAGRTTGIVLICLGGVDLLTTGDLIGGLWLAIIGWFLLNAAAAETSTAQAEQTLHGLLVRDVMDPHLTPVPSYLSCDAAARQAVAGDADFCPVVDFDGHVVGVIDVSRLVQAARLSPQPTVGAVMTPVADKDLAAPDDELLSALRRTGGRLPIVVVSDTTLVGLVTRIAVTHAMRRALVSYEPVG